MICPGFGLVICEKTCPGFGLSFGFHGVHPYQKNICRLKGVTSEQQKIWDDIPINEEVVDLCSSGEDNELSNNPDE